MRDYGDFYIETVVFPMKIRKDEVFEIDALLQPTKALWENLEVFCVPDCCGIDAYSFLEKDIINGTMFFDLVKYVDLLTQLKDVIEQDNRKYISSRRFNHMLYSHSLIKILEHIISVLEKENMRLMNENT